MWLKNFNYPKEIRIYDNYFEYDYEGVIKIPFTEVDSYMFWDKKDQKNVFCIFLKDHRRFTLWISDEDKNTLIEHLDNEKIAFPDEGNQKKSK
jgi:hypothetical protein